MFTIKCPFCNSSEVIKNGFRKGAQFYRCKCCHKQFAAIRNRLSTNAIWYDYLEGKQTILEIANKHHVSESTIKRFLRKQVIEWSQPSLIGLSGYVHIDATYWGRNWGIIQAID